MLGRATLTTKEIEISQNHSDGDDGQHLIGGSLTPCDLISSTSRSACASNACQAPAGSRRGRPPKGRLAIDQAQARRGERSSCAHRMR